MKPHSFGALNARFGTNATTLPEGAATPAAAGKKEYLGRDVRLGCAIRDFFFILLTKFL